jgi:hypothetical protein
MTRFKQTRIGVGIEIVIEIGIEIEIEIGIEIV